MVINKGVFFDRDGVINRPKIKQKKPYAPRLFSDFYIYKDIKQLILKLINHNYLIFIVTNQPDIGNNLMDIKELNLMHKKLRSLVKIDEIYVCMHSQVDNCMCRKPSAYFLFQAQKKYNLNLKNCYFIGDRYSDMLAAQRANCIPIFIDKKYSETPFMNGLNVVKNTKRAVHYILKESQ